jgi:CRP-like cAMP-binding protein
MMERKLVISQRKADSWRFESSHERYERFCREYPAIAVRASIAHIASYLLMTPETLSRVRAGVL